LLLPSSLCSDLKPENILLDKEGHVRLCDFGFATQIVAGGDALPPLQDGCGTVMYMAPELVGKTQLATHGFPVDWWALGCVLFEMVTGK
jgi:serine/threonine protein kinase